MVAPTPKKKKIDAKQFAQDIEAGMHESALMAAYGLSQSELQRAMKKLEDRGLLKHRMPDVPAPNPAELRPKPAKPRPLEPRQKPALAKQEVFECPACGGIHTESFDECPHCGIVLSKFREEDYGPARQPIRDEPLSRMSVGDITPVKDGSRIWPIVGISLIVLVLVCGFLVHRSMKRAELQSLTQNVESVLNQSNGQTVPDYSRLAKIFGDATGAMAVVMESRRTPYSEKMHELYQKMVYLGELQKRAEWRGSGSVKGMAAYRNASRGAAAYNGMVRNELDSLAERLDAQRGALSGASEGGRATGEAEAQAMAPGSPETPGPDAQRDETVAQFEKAQDELRTLCTDVLSILATQ